MKHSRDDGRKDRDREACVGALCDALLTLEEQSECIAFLRDLCTPAELEALADRWRVVPLLRAGKPYRAIHDETGVSVTTIGRIARFLDYGNGGYDLAYTRLSARQEKQ